MRHRETENAENGHVKSLAIPFGAGTVKSYESSRARMTPLYVSKVSALSEMRVVPRKLCLLTSVLFIWDGSIFFENKFGGYIDL